MCPPVARRSGGIGTSLVNRTIHSEPRKSPGCSLCGSPVRVYPAWKGALLCLLAFVLARCEQMFAATNVCSTLAPEQPCPETTPGGRLGRGLEKPKSHFLHHLHAPQRDGVERASSS